MRPHNGLIINLYHHYPDTLYEPTFIDFYFNEQFYLKYQRAQFCGILNILNNNHYFKYEDFDDNIIGVPLFPCSCGIIDCYFANVNIFHVDNMVYFKNFIQGPDIGDEDDENFTRVIKSGKDFVVSKKKLEFSLLMAFSFLSATAIYGDFFVEKYNLKKYFRDYLEYDIVWLLNNGCLFIVLYKLLNPLPEFSKERALETIKDFLLFFHGLKLEIDKDIAGLLIDIALNDASEVTDDNSCKTCFKAYFATQVLFAVGEKISNKIWKELLKSKDCIIKSIAKMALKKQWIKNSDEYKFLKQKI